MSTKDSSTSLKSLGAPSYNYAGWCRLREVCRAVRDMQDRVKKQKEDVNRILELEGPIREQMTTVQTETVELRSLQKLAELAKCRLMTVQLKLIHFYGEMNEREEEASRRRDEVLRTKINIRERLSTLSSSRDALSAESSRLVLRRRKMLKELMSIYKIDLNVSTTHRIMPTECTCTSVATIAGLHLPDLRSLIGHSESEVSTAAGYVVQFLIVASQILNISLRFPVVFQASRSSIINPVTTEIFPLYSLSRNYEKFEEGLEHLNGNIAQLRSDCGLGTPNKYSTLANLHSLTVYLTTDDIEPKFLRPVRNVQSPSSVLRTSVSDSVMLEHLAKISESRNALTAADMQTVRSSNDRLSGGSNSLLFDSSAISALNLATRSTITDDAKVPRSESLNGELIYG